MKRRRFKGTATATMVIFTVSFIAISVLGWRQIERFNTTPAWVAAGNLSAGQVITKEYLQFGRGKKSDLAVQEPRALLGRKLLTDKEEGDVFLPSDLESQPRGWLADQVPEGRVLYTLIPQNAVIPHSQIRRGDRLDIVVKGGRGVRTVAQNVLLMGAMTPPNKETDSPKGRGLLTQLANMPSSKKGSKTRTGTPLILAVAPSDVYPLAAIGSAEEVTLVLHGEYEVKNGELLQIKPAATRRRVVLYMGSEHKNFIVNK